MIAPSELPPCCRARPDDWCPGCHRFMCAAHAAIHHGDLDGSRCHDHFEWLDTGLVTARGPAGEEIRLYRCESCDGIFAADPTWSYDDAMAEATARLGPTAVATVPLARVCQVCLDSIVAAERN